MNNTKRAKAAEGALAQHAKAKSWKFEHLCEWDYEEALIDVLADLRHFADKRHLNFGQCDRMAYQHYLAELPQSNVRRKGEV